MDGTGLHTLTDLADPESLLFGGSSSAPAESAKQPAKKRERAKKVAPEIAGPGVVVLGDRFVCSYSGEFSPSAIFIPGVDTACFHNIPCALAFLEESGAPPEVQVRYKQALCDAYEQPLELVERAPQRHYLANFGGDRFYDEWIGPLELWDRLTETSGTTVAQYKDRKQGAKGSAVKRGRGGDARVSFLAAPYVVAYGKGAAGCKLVNALDGVKEEEEHDAKDTMTMVRALRKLQTFIKGHDGEADFKIKSDFGEGYYAFFIGTDAPVTLPKLHNHIASSITTKQCYGPAVFIFTRKFSVKV